MEFELELKGPFWVEISSNDRREVPRDDSTKCQVKPIGGR